MNSKLSDEQKAIIEEKHSMVILANPGSGKTFTVSEKIKQILPDLHEYQGVIAISFTNKASDELKKRALSCGINKKNSFFGTIDKFYLQEIIYPFGAHVFSKPEYEFEIIDKDFKSDQRVVEFRENVINRGLLNEYSISQEYFKDFFIQGKILIETIGALAIYILDNSKACRNYLMSRYTHAIIDEYQDCGFDQHQIFLKLNSLGIICIAVGDKDQSIYGFAGKHSKYLLELTRSEKFKPYLLSKNYRCHPSIVNYSMRLLNSSFELLEFDELRVFKKQIMGSEKHIAYRIEKNIDRILDKFGVENKSDVAILVRGDRTGNIIDENLSMPHIYYQTTPLDTDASLWGGVFKKLLIFIHKQDLTPYEVAEDYFDVELENKSFVKLIVMLEELKKSKDDLINNEDKFTNIAKFIYSNAENTSSIIKLKKVLSSDAYISSYKSPNKNEIQIMNIHKSKGLEFDIVFHLDLYVWRLPMKYDGRYSDYDQDLNLHYVGITRAKKACFLLTSTQYTNSKLNITQAYDSEFFNLKTLDRLRKNI